MNDKNDTVGWFYIANDFITCLMYSISAVIVIFVFVSRRTRGICTAKIYYYLEIMEQCFNSGTWKLVFISFLRSMVNVVRVSIVVCSHLTSLTYVINYNYSSALDAIAATNVETVVMVNLIYDNDVLITK